MPHCAERERLSLAYVRGEGTHTETVHFCGGGVLCAHCTHTSPSFIYWSVREKFLRPSSHIMLPLWSPSFQWPATAVTLRVASASACMPQWYFCLVSLPLLAWHRWYLSTMLMLLHFLIYFSFSHLSWCVALFCCHVIGNFCFLHCFVPQLSSARTIFSLSIDVLSAYRTFTCAICTLWKHDVMDQITDNISNVMRVRAQLVLASAGAQWSFSRCHTEARWLRGARGLLESGDWLKFLRFCAHRALRSLLWCISVILPLLPAAVHAAACAAALLRGARADNHIFTVAVRVATRFQHLWSDYLSSFHDLFLHAARSCQEGRNKS